MMTCLGKAVCIELVCTNLSKHYYKLLGTYEELQKAANSFIMSANLCIEVWYLSLAGQIF
jgi:hypothetical protein